MNLLSCAKRSLLFIRLKDDDSGDHDQNEENNTQKDSEKEKNDREKPQSTTKRKVPCIPLLRRDVGVLENQFPVQG